jgi:hypothetical protein
MSNTHKYYLPENVARRKAIELTIKAAVAIMKDTGMETHELCFTDFNCKIEIKKAKESNEQPQAIAD